MLNVFVIKVDVVQITWVVVLIDFQD